MFMFIPIIRGTIAPLAWHSFSGLALPLSFDVTSCNGVATATIDTHRLLFNPSSPSWYKTKGHCKAFSHPSNRKIEHLRSRIKKRLPPVSLGQLGTLSRIPGNLEAEATQYRLPINKYYTSGKVSLELLRSLDRRGIIWCHQIHISWHQSSSDSLPIENSIRNVIENCAS